MRKHLKIEGTHVHGEMNVFDGTLAAKRLIFLSGVFIFVFFSNFTIYADNIFTPYLKDESPKIVETVSKEIKDGIEVTKLKFLSRTLPKTGEKVIIYGILARPVKEGKYPAMLVCHGGGGCAIEEWTSSWARKGYVAFSVDEPGIFNPAKANSTGPWNKYGWRTFTIDGDASRNMLFDGVVAGLNGLAFLRSRPDVDKTRVGIIGVSWGGYMTTILSGISGDRVKASFCIYGCGFYDIGSDWMGGIKRLKNGDMEKWLKALDAGRWAPYIKSNFFSCAASNDWFFWLSAVMKTYNEIKSPKNLVISPNISHQIRVPGGRPIRNSDDTGWAHLTSMEINWMDYYLKGEGKPFPKCSPGDKPERKDSNVKLFFKVDSPEKLKEVSVWYSYSERPSRTRFWKKIAPTDEGNGKYSALVPVNEPEFPVDWYALVSDKRNISVSTTLQTFDPVKLGFKPDERKEVLFNEDFESVNFREKWRAPFASRYKNVKYNLPKKSAHNGARGLCIKGKMILRCNDIRGTALKNSSAKGISLWARSIGKTGFDVMLMGEDENGKRAFWYAEVDNPGTEWKKIELTWEKFKYAGYGTNTIGPDKQKAPSKPSSFDMLSKQLAQFRIATPENAEIEIDDIKTIK